MRAMNSNVLKLVILFFTIAMVSCSNGSDGHEGHNHEQGAVEQVVHHGEGKEYNSAYVCPMHCEGSGSDQAGNCPVCGMAYVAFEEHVKNNHEHNH